MLLQSKKLINTLSFFIIISIIIPTFSIATNQNIYVWSNITSSVTTSNISSEYEHQNESNNLNR